MKLMYEIVKEEITKFYPAQPKVVDGVISADIGAIQTDVVRRREEFLARMRDDQALAILCHAMVGQISSIASLPQMQPQERQDAYKQTLMETVAIWEKSNERFNAQLEPKRSEN